MAKVGSAKSSAAGCADQSGSPLPPPKAGCGSRLGAVDGSAMPASLAGGSENPASRSGGRKLPCGRSAARRGAGGAAARRGSAATSARARAPSDAALPVFKLGGVGASCARVSVAGAGAATHGGGPPVAWGRTSRTGWPNLAPGRSPPPCFACIRPASSPACGADCQGAGTSPFSRRVAPIMARRILGGPVAFPPWSVVTAL